MSLCPPSTSLRFDVIVVGAGHAGIEAALASARSGCRTLMVTVNVANIGQMSCNPAIGGVGKGHIVREIDALGGEMGRAADECGIQFRRLNMSKGPAVRATRAQSDKARYRARMKRVVFNTPRLVVREAEVVDLVIVGERIAGVRTERDDILSASSVVLTTGTFLNGMLHVGDATTSGGRAGDRAATRLSAALAACGLELGRLKTGTCPRLDSRTIDYDGLERQPGDDPMPRFSFDDGRPPLPQVPCHLTYTNAATHEVISKNITKSAIYSGSIRSRGPRYCPSIEDKVVKFPQRTSHRVFLEPEGLGTFEVYPNGLSTSLPVEVQREFVATIRGLKHAEIVRPGYAIEYDYVYPTQLRPTLETRTIEGLFLAGQINGTTGYEEAAAQGFVAGVNAARRAHARELVVFARSESYIGVLIDDLVTKGVDGEPYRMFTSRAEGRLLLREDNADLRLAAKAIELGLLTSDRLRALDARIDRYRHALTALRDSRVVPNARTNEALERIGSAPLTNAVSGFDLLRRPGVTYGAVADLLHLGRCEESLETSLDAAAKYDGYVQRQEAEFERNRRLESTRIPDDIDYAAVPGLSIEVREKLASKRPGSLAQAARLSGITASAVAALAIHLRRAAVG